MESKVCKYAVVRFIPDLIRDEPINIGVIVHDPKEKLTDCKFDSSKIRKIERKPEFEFFKDILEEFYENFSLDKRILSEFADADFDNPKLLDQYSSHYCNQIQFSNVRAFYCDNVTNAVEKVFNEYVADIQYKYLDKRWSSERVKKEVYNAIVQKGLDKVVSKDVKIKSKYDTIDIDFKYVNGKPNLIKAFSFNDERDKQKVNKAKIWKVNFESIKELSEYQSVAFSTIIYPPKIDTEGFRAALNILREDAEIHFYNQLNPLLEKIQKEAH